MQKAILILLASLIVLGCDSDATASNNEESGGRKITESSWEYPVSKDEIRDIERRYAVLEAVSKRDSVGMRISLMKRDDGSTIVGLDLTGYDGYKVTRTDQWSGYNGYVPVIFRFDQGEPVKTFMYTPGSTDNDFIVIRDTTFKPEATKNFLESLKSSRKLVIEVPIESKGDLQFKFRPQGLNF